MKEKLTVVYMVAGISRRFGGGIKQLIDIKNSKTLIEFSLDQAISAGFNRIIFIVGNKTEQPFKNKFRNEYKRIPIEYAYQKYDPEKRDKPWGTTDALCCAKEIIKGPFVVCNGDDLYGEEAFKQLADHLKENQEDATLGYKLGKVIPDKGKTHRAVYESEGDYVKTLKETFDIEKDKIEEKGLSPESLVSMNIFALNPETLEFLDERLQNFKNNHLGDRDSECLLPEEISRLVKQGKIKVKLYPTDSKWIGVTNPGDQELAKKFLENSN